MAKIILDREAEREKQTSLRMKSKVESARVYTGLTKRELMECIGSGTSSSLFYGRLNHPEKFRIGELRSLAKMLKIPLSELLAVYTD